MEGAAVLRESYGSHFETRQMEKHKQVAYQGTVEYLAPLGNYEVPGLPEPFRPRGCVLEWLLSHKANCEL